MILGINHIGIVVRDLDETIDLLHRLLGAEVTEINRLEEAGQTSCMIQFGDSRYELMEPIGMDGVVGKFLEKHGEGFHHISLSTDDFESDCAYFEEQGAKIISRSELDGMHYAFTLPKTTGRVLYELVGK